MQPFIQVDPCSIVHREARSLAVGEYTRGLPSDSELSGIREYRKSDHPDDILLCCYDPFHVVRETWHWRRRVLCISSILYENTILASVALYLESYRYLGYPIFVVGVVRSRNLWHAIYAYLYVLSLSCLQGEVDMRSCAVHSVVRPSRSKVIDVIGSDHFGQWKEGTCRSLGI